MRRLSMIVVIFVSMLQATEANDDLDAHIDQAVKVYQSALDEVDRSSRVPKFRRAETLFAQVIERQHAEFPDQVLSADLYLNLGNAALGAEHLGPAILAYRRALLIDPNHRRARQNLEHARTLLPGWVETPEEDTLSLGSFFDWTHGFTPRDWYGVAACCFLIAMVFVAVYLRANASSMRYLALVFGFLWISTLLWAWLVTSQASVLDAVVIVPEVTARSADSVNSPARFREPLPSGVELSIVDDRDDWIRVQLSDSRQAWLPASAVESL